MMKLEVESCLRELKFARLIGLLILTAAVLSLADSAFAGDETDYSAPYLTVENGELVTKYPAKEHLAGAAGKPSVAGDATARETNGSQETVSLAITIAGIAAAAAFFLLRRRKRQRRSTGAGKT